MDWLLDARRDGAVDDAITSLLDHLGRHADRTAPAGGGLREQVRESVQESISAQGPTLWVHLDWTGLRPALTWRAVSEDQLDPSLTSDGGWCRVDPMDRRKLRAAASGDAREVRLPLQRTTYPAFDPDDDAVVDISPDQAGAAAATLAFVAAAEAHPAAAPDQLAAFAGIGLADATTAAGGPSDVDDAVRLFSETHDALGGRCDVVEKSDDRVELVVRDCPFGDAVGHSPSLCRVTEAMAGRFFAQAAGRATVVLDETIAYGDPACRLQVFLDHDGTDHQRHNGDEGAERDEIAGNTFHWPGRGRTGGTDKNGDAPRLELTVSLPRETHSVPVVRRLAAQALRAFGVYDADVRDVELAITEACANVVEHALDSDAYEVSIQLAADRCSITVVDRGYGFDATTVRHQEDDDAEGGRGLSLMRALVDNVDFVDEPQVGAVVHMVKGLHYDTDHPFHRAAEVS